MLKKLIVICAVLLSLSGTAQSLKYNGKETFKIVQITDSHYRINHSESKATIDLLEQVIKDEKPDLVVFTGDIVVDPEPVLDAWKEVITPLQKAEIPFAVTLGNHDDEQSATRQKIVDFLKTQPYNLTADGDYSIEVKNENGTTENILYFFDSNTYSTNDNVGGYGWMTHDQVADYISTSRAYKEKNGGKALPSLAFFHIPLPEHDDAYNNKVYPPIGAKGEPVCSPEINTGMFAAMVEAGDVMGCFVGHDHDNDYMGYLNNIALAYGRASNDGTTYGDLNTGCRVINLYKGKRAFDSYILELGGNKTLFSQYPRKLTFAITADTHFDPLPETDQYKNVVALNKLQLDGVAIQGDVFNRQNPEVINLFRERYEKGENINNSHFKVDSSLNTNVYIGLGNHDVVPVSEDPVQNEIERELTYDYVDSLYSEMREQKLITSFHEPTRSYSFNLNGLHFIQTHTYAGDNVQGEGGLDWLAKDLKRYASKGQPVVLLMHYTFSKSQRWINDKAREELANTLKGYNVLAIFNGHDHRAYNLEWNGINVYTADNVWPDSSKPSPSFYVLEYDKVNGLTIKQCFWDSDTLELTFKDLNYKNK